MKPINWSILNGTDFQKFCNSLLLLEVSKQAHVFSKEGKDKGIDQLYNGSYDGKSGTWRFQNKFHDSGAPSRDIAELKRDIKDDIKDNHDGENNLVFMTNVNLLPDKYKELQGTAEEAFKAKGVTCEFQLWHGAHLESLVTHHPIIYSWFWGRESILLQQYQDFFKRQLSESETDLRSQLRNSFFGRQNDLQKLNDFLHADKLSTAAIIANGGYGKTRLAIEFFKSDIVTSSPYLPMVLTPLGFNAQEFEHLLQSEKPLLILIDNAHEIAEVIPVAKQLIESSGKKHKLLLTTRKTLLYDINKQLRSFSKDIVKIELERLSYAETKAMIEKELPHIEEPNKIHLTDTSKGVPNVILELVRMIRQGKHPETLRGESSFLESVKEITLELADEIEREKGISKETTLDLLQVVALISPIDVKSDYKDIIGQILKVRPDKVGAILDKLHSNGILSTEPAIAIKPDPYSDAILIDAITSSKDFVQTIIGTPGFDRYWDNILKNLAEAEMVEGGKQGLADNIIKEYIDQLFTSDNPEKILSIFKTVASIVPFKPQTAFSAIKAYINYSQNQQHPVHGFGGWRIHSYFSDLTPIVSEILYNLVNFSKFSHENRKAVLNLTLELVHATGNLGFINSVYNYHRWNFHCSGQTTWDCCFLQIELQKYVTDHLQQGQDDWIIDTCLHASELLLSYEFQLEEYYEAATRDFTHGIMQVPYCTHIKGIRTNIAQALISFYKSAADSKQRENTFSQLLNYFFYASTGFKQRYAMNLDDEFEIILSFFHELLSSSVPLTVKTEVAETIGRFALRGYKDKWKDRIVALNDLANKTDSHKEALELLLNKRSHFEVKNNFDRWIKELAGKYPSIEEFIADLISLRKASVAMPPQFITALSVIGTEWPEQARKLFDLIQDTIPEYVTEAYGLITPAYKDTEYFLKILQWHWDRKDQYIDRLLWLSTVGRKQDKDFYRVEELDYYEYILDNDIVNYFERVAYILIDYAYINKEKTFDLLDRYLKKVGKSFMPPLSYNLLLEDRKYSGDFKAEIHKLFYDNRKLIDLDALESRLFLSFLDKKYGFEEVVGFVYEQEKMPREGNDQYYRRPSYAYFRDDIPEEGNAKRYAYLVEKYIESGSSDLDIWKATMRKFAYGESVSEIQVEALKPLLGKYSDDLNKLIRLAAATHRYEKLNEAGINFLCSIAEIGIKLNPDQKIHEFFPHDFNYNTGSRSKVGVGVAYVEDLEKKKLLEQIISENRYEPQVISYLNSILADVNHVIKEEIERDKEQLNW
jgi:hypothetical protein